MLASLDNETIFKQAFTDKTVFKSFVKDIEGREQGADNERKKMAGSCLSEGLSLEVISRLAGLNRDEIEAL